MSEFTLETADILRRAVGDMVRAIQQTEDIPGGQIEALGFLFRDGPLSIAQLARRRKIRHQSMSATVADLQGQGLVARTPDPADGRGVLIELTASGSAMIRESRLTRSTVILHAAERALTPAELTTLAQVSVLFDKVRVEITRD